MKFPRVLAESEDFFAGLQHPDSPVQIRSAPLKKPGKSTFFGFFLFFKACKKIRWQIFFDQQKYFSCITISKLIPTKNFKLKTARNRIKSNKIGS